MKLFFNAALQLSAIYYPAGCDAVIPPHYSNPCDPAEHARVRSVALIRSNHAFLDPSSTTEWRAGITAGNIVIIPEVLGSYNGGDPVEGTGYGNQASKLTGYNFEVSYKDPNYAQNADFYNALKYSRSWKIAFVTENYTHISTSTVSFIPKNPITDSLTDEVVWDVTAKFSQGDIPTPFPTPDNIFEYFDYVATPGGTDGSGNPLVFDTILTFEASQEDNAMGVAGGVAAINPTIKFEFNKITATLIGAPINMSVMHSGIEKIAITTQTDYVGRQFRFTDVDGQQYLGTFASGNVTPV